MSISSEINRIAQNISDSLDAVAAKGVTVPTGSTSDDLPELIAQITGGSGSGNGGIVISDTTDAAGGTVRTITGVTISGTKTITENGTGIDVTSYETVDVNVSGGGGGSVVISDEANATGTTAVVTADDVATLITKSITQNGTYSASSDSADGYSSVTVNVSGGSPSVTQHSIYFEFSDSTSTTIPVYYDDALLSTMITAYTPETYSGKTVDLAQLDGVTWYARPTEVWETIYEGTTTPFTDTPYNYWWISSLSDVYPTVGSVWRVTINGTSWVTTARQSSGMSADVVYIGNPKYSGGQDDGSGMPTNFYNAGWGAWVGDTELVAETNYALKIERRVS